MLKSLYRELQDTKWRLSQLRKQYDSAVNKKDFLTIQLEESKKELTTLRKDSRDFQDLKQVLGSQNVELAIKKGRRLVAAIEQDSR